MAVFLIGFMGSGKTTAGSIVADKLGYKFTDLDEYIENKYQHSIREIFMAKGEDYFRSIERDALMEFANLEKTIVATGGGCPCYAGNIEWMNNNGETIYLKAHHGTIYLRLQATKKNRPLISELNDVALMEFILNTLPERTNYYKMAKFIVETKTEKPDILAEKISNLISTKADSI